MLSRPGGHKQSIPFGAHNVSVLRNLTGKHKCIVVWVEIHLALSPPPLHRQPLCLSWTLLVGFLHPSLLDSSRLE